MQNFISSTILDPHSGAKSPAGTSQGWHVATISHSSKPSFREEGRRERCMGKKTQSAVSWPHFTWGDCMHRAQCCLSVSQRVLLWAAMLRKASALKSCSILEIRKQVITNKTIENKVPPAYILFLLLLLPPTNFLKRLHSSPQQTEREIAFPHLRKMAPSSPAPLPPQPSCPTWGPSSTPCRWPGGE